MSSLTVEKIKKICVLGAGTMGHGIAQVFAMAGYEVWMRDIEQSILDNAMQKISWSLNKLHSKGRIKETPEEILARIHPTLDVEEACKDADFVIEVVPEILDLKKKIFAEVDQLVPPHAILASNTSSLPISELAKATKRPDKVIGMHFFNPPVILKLVEVIKGDETSDEVANLVIELAKKIGKEPVLVKKDSPGFIVNRILGAIIHEAIWSLERGEHTIEEIDAATRFKADMPMGIFELMDYIGIDVVYHMMKAMKERGVKFEIPKSFEELFNSGNLGVKTGKGYYTYPKPGKYVKPSLSPKQGMGVNIIKLLAPAINEAARLLENGVASLEDIDKAIKLGLNFPYGIFEIADTFGLDAVVNALNELKNERGFELYEATTVLVNMVNEKKLGRKTGKGFYEYEVSEKSFETIKIRYEPPIAWLILNRPDKLNAMTIKMLDEIEEALKTLDSDEQVRAVIIMGEGKAFCAGADVKDFEGMTGTDAFKYSRKIQGVFERIEELTKPVIAAVHGYALGGGLELAMACDLIIATRSTLIGQPEINLGIIPGAGATQKLSRIIGSKKAKELIFLGEMIPAEEGERLGLINKVVLDNELELEARKMALKIASKPPLSLMVAKYVINYGKDVAEKVGKIIEALGFGLVRSTEDATEGIKAFLEKKKPRFKGK